MEAFKRWAARGCRCRHPSQHVVKDKLHQNVTHLGIVDEGVWDGGQRAAADVGAHCRIDDMYVNAAFVKGSVSQNTCLNIVDEGVGDGGQCAAADVGVRLDVQRLEPDLDGAERDARPAQIGSVQIGYSGECAHTVEMRPAMSEIVYTAPFQQFGAYCFKVSPPKRVSECDCAVSMNTGRTHLWMRSCRRLRKGR